MTKRDELMLDLLQEMRSDIKGLQTDVSALKAQRQVLVWIAGAVGSAITFLATHLPTRLFNGS